MDLVGGLTHFFKLNLKNWLAKKDVEFEQISQPSKPLIKMCLIWFNIFAPIFIIYFTNLLPGLDIINQSIAKVNKRTGTNHARIFRKIFTKGGFNRMND